MGVGLDVVYHEKVGDNFPKVWIERHEQHFFGLAPLRTWTVHERATYESDFYIDMISVQRGWTCDLFVSLRPATCPAQAISQVPGWDLFFVFFLITVLLLFVFFCSSFTVGTQSHIVSTISFIKLMDKQSIFRRWRPSLSQAMLETSSWPVRRDKCPPTDRVVKPHAPWIYGGWQPWQSDRNPHLKWRHFEKPPSSWCIMIVNHDHIINIRIIHPS